jgi:hypothetical protein
MKKITFFLAILMMLAAFAHAQSYKDIGNKVLLNQYKDAKTDIDKRITNQKFASKPDAFILKAAIYAKLASEGTGTESDQLLAEAESAYKTYTEMDPELSLVNDPLYRNGIINLYSALYSHGYADYQAKKWEESYTEFKRMIELSDVMIDKKVLTMALDTTGLILVGYTAENSDHKDEAEKYYAKLADNKVAGEGNEFIYRSLVLYNYQKKDMAAFTKYKALGKELYPESEYFDYTDTDFAVGLAPDFNAKIKALDEVLARDPSSYTANVTLAQLIYDTLSAGPDVRPANADDLEVKMLKALHKAAELKPDDEKIFMVLGDHYISKSEKANEERADYVKAMQSRTKPGTKASAQDIAKRDELDKKYGEWLEKAREPYEKAAALLAKKTELSPREKQQYRNIAGYLGDIYNFKKTQAKANPGDAAKYEAEAKKWNDLYDNLR